MAVMAKRIALLLGAIVALTIWNPAASSAQEWGGGWGGGGWGGGGVTVTVSGFPGPVFRRPPCCRPFIPPRPVACCRPFIPPRPVACCEIPRPVACCEVPIPPRPVGCCAPFFHRGFARPPYFYGDRFAPYAYNPYGWDEAAGYGGDGYEGW